MTRWLLALKVWWRTLTDAEFAQSVEPVLTGEAPEELTELTPPLPREATHLLRLLQREGRLVDFLMEDVSGYGDAEIGAAARAVHEGCRKVLHDCFTIQPVRSESEGNAVTVPNDFEPSHYRLVGQVSGRPPFQGTLQHAGWIAKGGELPSVAAGQDPALIAPAEVEVAPATSAS